MSSDQPLSKRTVNEALRLGNQAYHRTFAGADRLRTANVGIRGRSLLDVAGVGGSGPVDLARNIAVLMLRTAVSIAEDCVEAAGQLESVVTGQPLGNRDGKQAEPDEPTAPASVAPAALVLRDASPGGISSATFEVRNDSRETIDGMRLRCGGLFGAGDVRIASSYIKFSQATFDVAPRHKVEVTCNVNVPKSAKLGQYTGLIEARGLPGVQLLVSLDVI